MQAAHNPLTIDPPPSSREYVHHHGLRSAADAGHLRQEIQRRVPIPPAEITVLSLAGIYGFTVFIRALIDLIHDTDKASQLSGMPASFFLITVWFSLKETRNKSPGWKRYSAYAAAICTGIGLLLNILKTAGVLDKNSVWPSLFMALGTLVLPIVFWPPETDKPTRSGKIGQRTCISLGTMTSLMMVITAVLELGVGNQSGYGVIRIMNQLANALTALLFAGNGAFESIRKTGWPWWKQAIDISGFLLAATSLILQSINLSRRLSISNAVINMVTNMTVPAWSSGMLIAIARHIFDPLPVEGPTSAVVRARRIEAAVQSPPTPHVVQGWCGWFLKCLDTLCCRGRRHRPRVRAITYFSAFSPEMRENTPLLASPSGAGSEGSRASPDSGRPDSDGASLSAVSARSRSPAAEAMEEGVSSRGAELSPSAGQGYVPPALLPSPAAEPPTSPSPTAGWRAWLSFVSPKQLLAQAPKQE